MTISWLDIVFYVSGLVLLLMPPRFIPLVRPGSEDIRRVVKHVLALVLFVAGTVGIHRTIYQRAGNRFLVASCLLVLVIGLFRIWQEKYGEASE